ncbi:MAG: hypothetical protein IPH42_09875 [Bacteroidetes bacterium]|nr:hypothetical protein [Bacteroidota bacterium]
MKRVITILITTIYLSGIFSPFYVYAGYYLNKDYIKENLCINQAKPEMDCEGKCFLNTQIIKEVTKTAGTKSENNPENSPNFFTPHFISSNKLLISPANSFI